MIKNGHFCYLPTNKLCELSERLTQDFFPSDFDDVIRQEIVTYKKNEFGMKKTTFTRHFYSDGSHEDQTSSEVFVIDRKRK